MTIQFENLKVQASIAANMWVVGGSPQTKKLQDVLPGIVNQLGPGNLDNLCELAEQFKKQVPGAGGDAKNTQEEDDDVPDLVEGGDFEARGEILKLPQKIIVLLRQILLKKRNVLCYFILPSVASTSFMILTVLNLIIIINHHFF